MVEERARESAEPPGDRVDHSHDIYTVANIITILRLILVPFAFAVLIEEVNDTLAFALFALAASTDWLDGQIARRTGTVTAIGRAIDPMVDRLLLAAGVIGLYVIGRLPAWIMVVLVVRDAYLLYGAWRLEHHHLRLPVTRLGKWTTAVLLGGFSILILGWPVVPVADGTRLGLLFVYVGIAMSLTSAAQYTLLAARAIARVKAGGGGVA